MTNAKLAARSIARWLQCNFMAASDDLMHAAVTAWRSLQLTDRADNKNEVSERLNKADVQTFVMKLRE